MIFFVQILSELSIYRTSCQDPVAARFLQDFSESFKHQPVQK